MSAWKMAWMGMTPWPTATQTLGGGVGEILDMEVAEAGAGGVDGRNDVGSSAQGVAEVDAEVMRLVQILHRGEDVEG